jgi:hypothetical protein
MTGREGGTRKEVVAFGRPIDFQKEVVRATWFEGRVRGGVEDGRRGIGKMEDRSRKMENRKLRELEREIGREVGRVKGQRQRSEVEEGRGEIE